ncbi:uncharacterized protein LOC121429461 [Lytechinus variegatus]|uniref:uncharacterized protein LOC121429461 n=1 Tax=Lytechinus variegatus TaxID=7654 RepID=UPI001BB20400|nr:uncharacterized protein LOC121429461 [Lytechinus variegatus]
MFNFPALKRFFEGHMGSEVPAEVSDEWTVIQEGLEMFEECPECKPSPSSLKTITRVHWKKGADCHVCSNAECKQNLWAISKHHCRRCGNVFCGKCTQFRRNLSPDAAYDPNGWPHKVCEKCFYDDPQTVGFSKSHRDYFEGWRAAKHLESKVLTRPTILCNLKNLVEGFACHYKPPPPPPPDITTSPVDPSTAPSSQLRKPRLATSLFKGVSAVRQGVSGIQNAPRWMKQSVVDLHKAPGRVAKGVSEVPGRVKQGVTGLKKAETWKKRVVPEWQKPPTWVEEGASCQCCDRPYPPLEQRHNCRVCGKLVCKAQSSLDLLLYKPDPIDQVLAGSHARWALIRVVGSPEVEPDHHLYLRICQPCRDHLQIIQVEEYHRLNKGQGLVNLCWQQMLVTYQDIMGLRSKIDHELPEFQEIVAQAEVGAGNPEFKVKPDSDNKDQLANYQSEISHHLSSLVAVICRLKELHPQTQGQVKVLKNIIKCQQSYYMEMSTQFKQLLAQLKQITPKTVHQQIIDLLETEALNSACASLNQLEMECRYLCETHHLDINIPLIIKETAEVVEIEIKDKMEETGADWSEQKEELEEFVYIQLEGLPEANILPHRIIQPSKHLLRHLGSYYLHWLVSRKAVEVFRKIRLQLMIRNAAKASLQATSQSLERLTQSIQEEAHKEEQKH